MVGHGGAGVGREVLGTVLWTKSRQSLEKQEVDDDDDDDDDPSSMITMVGAEPGEGPHPRKGTHPSLVSSLSTYVVNILNSWRIPFN